MAQIQVRQQHLLHPVAAHLSWRCHAVVLGVIRNTGNRPATGSKPASGASFSTGMWVLAFGARAM
jgi:hypothetical protein